MEKKDLIPIGNRGDDLEMTKCKNLCQKYNATKEKQQNKRLKILTKLLNKIGKNPWIEPNIWCDYGYNISIGDDFYSNHDLVLLDCAKITIGNNVFIGPQCGIYAANHPMDHILRQEYYAPSKEITIGNDVWIGGGVKIMHGVSIGDRCVIGAGSVVTRSIEAGSVAVGNPCRVIRSVEERGYELDSSIQNAQQER